MTTPTNGTITVSARARISRRGKEVAEEIARARLDRTLRRANLAIVKGHHVAYRLEEEWVDAGVTHDGIGHALHWSAPGRTWVVAHVQAEPPPKDTVTLQGPDGPIRTADEWFRANEIKATVDLGEGRLYLDGREVGSVGSFPRATMDDVGPTDDEVAKLAGFDPRRIASLAIQADLKGPLWGDGVDEGMKRLQAAVWHNVVTAERTHRPAAAAMERVLAEYDAQQAKHGHKAQSIHRATVTDFRRLRVLVEEVGEIAEAMDSEHTGPEAEEHLLAEVAQVGAVALAWLHSRTEVRLADLPIYPQKVPSPDALRFSRGMGSA